MRRSATTRIRAAEHHRHAARSSCPRDTRHGSHRRGAQGDLRRAQPKGTLRYKPTDNLTFYGGWSRGFRSGGFNQTGVGAVAAAAGHLGVHDVFQAEIADTWEVGAQEPVPRPAADRESGALRHQVAQWLLLLLRRHDLDAEPRQSRRHATRAPELELNAQSDRLARPVRELSATRTARSPRMEDPTVIGNKPPLLTQGHRQRRLPVPPAARRRAQRRAAPRLSDDRPHLVGPVQPDLARSGQPAGPARRPRGRPLVGDRLVEESDQQDLQCGVLDRAASCGEPCRAATGWTSPSNSEQGERRHGAVKKLPLRLHHNAYVTRDQEKTRQFYEDVIGMPLVATWCESDELFGKVRTYCHTFYAIGDGGALAFFQFADPSDQEEFGPEDAGIAVSSHRARGRSRRRRRRSRSASPRPASSRPDTYVLEHGYCRSVYVTDPNGLILEFTLDHPGGGEDLPRPARGCAPVH